MEDKTMRAFRFSKDARANANRVCERAIQALERATLEEADDILDALKVQLKQLRTARAGTQEVTG
jgi:hypothetical protein